MARLGQRWRPDPKDRQLILIPWDTCCGELIASIRGKDVYGGSLFATKRPRILPRMLVSILRGSHVLLVIHISGVSSKDSTTVALYRMTEWVWKRVAA